MLRKKAIKLFYNRFKRVKSYIDYILLSRRKEIIVSELRRLSLKFSSGLIIYDINFEIEVRNITSWEKLREDKNRLKMRREYDKLTLINVLDNALRWFKSKKESKLLLDP